MRFDPREGGLMWALLLLLLVTGLFVLAWGE